MNNTISKISSFYRASSPYGQSNPKACQPSFKGETVSKEKYDVLVLENQKLKQENIRLEGLMQIFMDMLEGLSNSHKKIMIAETTRELALVKKQIEADFDRFKCKVEQKIK